MKFCAELAAFQTSGMSRAYENGFGRSDSLREIVKLSFLSKWPSQ
jgi:hypothetical protein